MIRNAARVSVSAAVALTVALSLVGNANNLTLPLAKDSTRFAVIGDTGTGDKPQYEIGRKLEEYRQQANFTFTIMVGDNIYGSERPQDFQKKFEMPYKPLLDAGVTFYAALGNHDDPNQRFYKLFNMNGERFYSFKAPKATVRFFALDSNYLDKTQFDWLAKELAGSDSDWKIAFFHHPIYSSGEKHGSHVELREQVEPLFLKHGVDVVFTGHEHFYERLKPQNGIHYIITGSAAKLRRGNIGTTGMTAKGFDDGYTFMLIEIAGDEMFFQTIDENGKTVDSGVIVRREVAATSVSR
jgi:predicted phosphodiesterase